MDELLYVLLGAAITSFVGIALMIYAPQIFISDKDKIMYLQRGYEEGFKEGKRAASGR